MLALPATPGHARAAHRRCSTFVLLAASTLAGLFRWTGILHHVRMDTGEWLLHQSGNYSVLLGPDDEFISDVSHGNFQSDATFGDEVCPLLAQPA